jgi:hypothetical protein
MAKEGFNSAHKAALDALLLKIPGVKAGKMFGYPAYYAGGKLFACVYGEGVGTKVPEALARRLLAEPHIVAFRPMGRPPMREWVRINRADSKDYAQDVGIFRRAARFVGSMAKNR